MTSTSSQHYFESFINYENRLDQVRASEFKLDRMRCLLEELGNPQEAFKVIHVAGSKGKGSVCAVVASILKRAGYRVGLYTSPHINHYNERIRVLESEPTKPTPGVGCLVGEEIFPDCITEEELRSVIEEVEPAVGRVQSFKELGLLSFFEACTAMALCFFRRRRVDFAVLETGLGGRLDATNAVESMVAVITRISLEHTRLLGDTLGKIALEKAGIIKTKEQRVVLAPQTAEVWDILNKHCEAIGIEPLQVRALARHGNVKQSLEGQTFDLILGKEVYPRLTIPLLGEHQRDNAATGIAVIQCLREEGVVISEEAVRDGCRRVFWPGRMEIIRRDPLVLLDGAHDPASAKVLVKTVREVIGRKKVILVLGMSRDKDQEGIRAALEKIAKKIIWAKADHPRAADLPGAVDVAAALEQAQQEAAPADIILVAGSIFVVGEARKHLLSNRKRENGRVKMEC